MKNWLKNVKLLNIYLIYLWPEALIGHDSNNYNVEPSQCIE